MPRLLRPLETEGRILKPSLVHGDLWEGNTVVDGNTKEPLIFDSSAFWAHNEYELGIWRAVRSKLGRPFIEEYFRLCPPSPPTEDMNDRNGLYAM